jgi:hypothetical protein
MLKGFRLSLAGSRTNWIAILSFLKEPQEFALNFIRSTRNQKNKRNTNTKQTTKTTLKKRNHSTGKRKQETEKNTTVTELMSSFTG